MPFYEKQAYVSGNLVVDGTIEGKHVRAETITANKFSGAVEEEYRCHAGATYLGSYNTLYNVIEFDHPATEWDIAKGRSINALINLSLFAGTSSTRTGQLTFQQELEVPNFWNPNAIAVAVHDSQPEQYWQRVVLDGNQLNKFPSNMVMAHVSGSPVYRTYKNLRLQYDYEGSELVTNGSFSGTGDWTAANGTFTTPYYGTLNGVSGSTEKAQISQAVSVTAGKKYRLKYDQPTSTTYKVIVSTSTDPDDEIEYQGGLGWVSVIGTNVREFIVDVSTVYIIIQTINAGADSAFFDNVSLKELQLKTYVDISSYPTQLINPSSSSTVLYSGLTTGATAGTWVIAKTALHTISNDNSYSKYENVSMHTYLGRFHRDIKCRLRAKHGVSSISTTALRVVNVDFTLHSRIVG